LPAPFGPSSPKTIPLSTSRLRSSTASTFSPKRFVKLTSIIGGDDAPIGPDVDVAIWLANKLLTVKVSEM
jgi:hypothetical protein